LPVYEYECTACKGRFERKQSFSEESIKVCPTCGGETRRVLHAPGIVFKGSGWYITDSRKSESSPSESKSDTSASPAASTGGSSEGGAGSSTAASSGTTAGASGGTGGSSSSGAGSSGGGGSGGKSD